MNIVNALGSGLARLRTAPSRITVPAVTALAMAFAWSALACLSRPAVSPSTLWFPVVHGEGTVAELRYLPAGEPVAKAAARLLDEALLGPLDARGTLLAVPGSDVRSTILKGNVLYLDLSDDVLFGREAPGGRRMAPPVDPERLVSLLSKTLAWNFPGKRIVLTINGFEPEWPLRAPPEEPK